MHVDGVQAWGKVPIRLMATSIDSYAVSGHKIHAPKGVGALYLRQGYHLAQTLFGGHQEQGFRPGTENIAYVAAMAAAITLVQSRPFDASALRSRLLAGLARLPDVVRNSPDDALPSIVNFSAEGVRSETLLHFLESRQVYVSSGSACSKGDPSHTLTAMGLSRARVDGAVRVSFSGENTAADVDALLSALAEGLRSLARTQH